MFYRNFKLKAVKQIREFKLLYWCGKEGEECNMYVLYLKFKVSTTHMLFEVLKHSEFVALNLFVEISY